MNVCSISSDDVKDLNANADGCDDSVLEVRQVEKKNSFVCLIHHEEFGFFCNNCGFPICSMCKTCIEDHDVTPIDKKVTVRKTELFSFNERERKAFFKYIENRAKLKTPEINKIKGLLDTIDRNIKEVEKEISDKRTQQNRNNDKIGEIKQMILDISGLGNAFMTEKLVSMLSELNGATQVDEKMKSSEKSLSDLKEERDKTSNMLMRVMSFKSICESVLKLKDFPVDSFTEKQWKKLSVIDHFPYKLDKKISVVETFEAFEGSKALDVFDFKTRNESIGGSIVGGKQAEEMTTTENSHKSRGKNVPNFPYKKLVGNIKISGIRDIPINSPVSNMKNVHTTISPKGNLYYNCLESKNFFIVNLRNFQEQTEITETGCHNHVAICGEKVFVFGSEGKYVVDIDENELISKKSLIHGNKSECSDVKGVFSSSLSNINKCVYYCDTKFQLCSYDLEQRYETALKRRMIYGVVDSLSIPLQNIKVTLFDTYKSFCILGDDEQTVAIRCGLLPQYALTLTDNRIEHCLFVTVNSDLIWGEHIISADCNIMPRCGFSLIRIHGNVFLFHDEKTNKWGCFHLRREL